MKQVIIVTLFKPILWALDHLVLFVTNGCVKYLIYSSYRWAHRVLVAQSVKNLPAMQETLVQSLGQEDPLEKETAAHSSILAWRISWTEEPGGLHIVHGAARSQT